MKFSIDMLLTSWEPDSPYDSDYTYFHRFSFTNRNLIASIMDIKEDGDIWLYEIFYDNKLINRNTCNTYEQAKIITDTLLKEMGYRFVEENPDLLSLL